VFVVHTKFKAEEQPAADQNSGGGLVGTPPPPSHPLFTNPDTDYTPLTDDALGITGEQSLPPVEDSTISILHPTSFTNTNSVPIATVASANFYVLYKEHRSEFKNMLVMAMVHDATKFKKMCIKELPLAKSTKFHHGWSLLHESVKQVGLEKNIIQRDTYRDIIKFLINDCKVDVNIQCKSTLATPLHQAAYRGDLETAQFLLENGANLYARTRGNYLPLHNAILQGHCNVIDLYAKRSRQDDILF
jgi:hypothetical protein